jgi:lipopolysaccharide/colanic/teichoic acid biosynthesis glycosyltransferase
MNAPCPISPAPTPSERLRAAVLLALTAPAILLIGAAIRAEDGGPALVRHRRLDAHGCPIVVRRFRTHRDDGRATIAPHAVTAVGRFLQRAALDELPLLISIARGEHPWSLPRLGWAPLRPQRTVLSAAAKTRRQTQRGFASRPPLP